MSEPPQTLATLTISHHALLLHIRSKTGPELWTISICYHGDASHALSASWQRRSR